MTGPFSDTPLNKGKHIVIAIDGYASCGKSTIAKDLAKSLDFTYIDTGAMYRAVTYLMIKNKISLDDKTSIQRLLNGIKIGFKKSEGFREIHVNGENIEKYIRTPEVASLVSPVAELSAVRKKLVELQQDMARGESVIVEGRDIATVVFPNADLKFFVTADIETRAKRRFEELNAKGTPQSIDQVKKNLEERDRIDSTRDDSPLTMTEDAILIDTTHHSRESQLALIKSYVDKLVMKDN